MNFVGVMPEGEAEAQLGGVTPIYDAADHLPATQEIDHEDLWVKVTWTGLSGSPLIEP